MNKDLKLKLIPEESYSSVDGKVSKDEKKLEEKFLKFSTTQKKDSICGNDSNLKKNENKCSDNQHDHNHDHRQDHRQDHNDDHKHNHDYKHNHDHNHSSHERGSHTNHDHNQEPNLSEKAKRKLIIVSGVCSIFMIIEFTGGLLSSSLAIMTDAAHLLSDLGGFLISIFAIYIAKFPSNQQYTYGYHRAEIVGALLSVFLIWILTTLLLSESIARLFDPHHKVDGKLMLITSSIGLVFNLIMAYILHSGVHINI
jgi:Co/Zn/Cd efflux system component